MRDPERRTGLFDDMLDLVHRSQRLLAIKVGERSASFAAAQLEVVEIPTHDKRACLVKIQPQHLVSGRVTRCREDTHTSVAEYVVISVEDQKVGLSEIFVQRRVENLEVLEVYEGSLILRPLDQDRRLREGIRGTNVVEVHVREGRELDVGGREPEFGELVDPVGGQVAQRSLFIVK